jgi:hypothetical protein
VITRVLRNHKLVIVQVGDLWRASIDGRCIAYFATERRAREAARDEAHLLGDMEDERRRRARRVERLLRKRRRRGREEQRDAA